MVKVTKALQDPLKVRDDLNIKCQETRPGREMFSDTDRR